MERIPFDIARNMIVKNHYIHKLNSASLCLGFFFNRQLGGVITYGTPVGRRVIKSIDETLENGEVWELTRLFAYDWLVKNTESRMISLSIKYIKVMHQEIKCLISYADPTQGHLGTIYQASNWLYQGNETMLVKGFHHVINGEVMHPRTVVSRFGTINQDYLTKIDPDYKRIHFENKHRYIYPLTKLNLKHPIKPYPKCAGGVKKCILSIQGRGSGVTPTPAHQLQIFNVMEA